MQDHVLLIELDKGMCRHYARRLRAENICCRMAPADITADELLGEQPRGVLLIAPCSGVPAEIPHMVDYLQAGLPMLCIGDAALTLCQTIGGEMSEPISGGLLTVEMSEDDPVLAGIENDERFLPDLRMMQIPKGTGSVVSSVAGDTLGFKVTQRDVWGLNLPLERNDPVTIQVLMNFVRDVCGCTQWWTRHAIIEGARGELLEQAGEGEALCALSGGVDSGVSALLGKLALGDRLHCIFVDTGLLREGEADDVMAFYSDVAGLNVKRIDAQEEFLSALDGIYAPTDKERVINRLLQEIIRREAEQLPQVTMIIRGTNITDTPVPEENMPDGLQLAAPVRGLFKDEIRNIGDALGMPPAMLQKQPFPGSGLATRILSGVTATGVELVRQADAIFRKEIESAGLQKRLWQYFATLAVSPIPNGGYLVILRAVQASDSAAGMPARLPSDLLERISEIILRDCPGVQRVFYDLSPSQSYKRMAGA